jgi:hypothetical protein
MLIFVNDFVNKMRTRRSLSSYCNVMNLYRPMYGIDPRRNLNALTVIALGKLLHSTVIDYVANINVLKN